MRADAVVSHRKLAISAYVDDYMLGRLYISNVQQGQHTLSHLARPWRDYLRPDRGTAYRPHPQYTSRGHAPQRLAPARGTVGCSGVVGAPLGSMMPQQSACRQPTDRVSRAPDRLNVSAGIAAVSMCVLASIGIGGDHPSGKGASSSVKQSSAPIPGRPSTRARPRWWGPPEERK